MKEKLDVTSSPSYMRGQYALTLRKQGKSFRDIAKEFNVSVERVRQIIVRTEKAAESYRKFDELKERCSSLVKRSEVPSEILSGSIDDMNLSARASSCLRNANINTIGDLLSKPIKHLAGIKNMGRITLHEIENVLNELGLGLLDMPLRVSSRSLPYIHPALRYILNKRGWRETVCREWILNIDDQPMNWEDAVIAEFKRGDHAV